MIPNREKLEAVWNSSELGWLKNFNKNNRNKTMFTLVAKPYVKQYLDPIETEVWTKNSSKALDHRWTLSEKVREKYPEEYKSGNFGWDISVKQ